MAKQLYPTGVVDFVVAHGVRGDLEVFEPSKTRQEFADECDINTLMARYEAGGAITHVNRAEPVFADLTQYPDFRGALDMMREASLMFASLPAKVRREFDNDASAFVDFAQNPENIGKMREWGLAAPEVVPEPPLKVEVVVPPGSPLPEPPKA